MQPAAAGDGNRLMDSFSLNGAPLPTHCIRALKPKVNKQEALSRLDPRSLFSSLMQVGRGPLRMLAEVYVPFRMFRVEVNNCSRRDPFFLSVDAVTGQLDPYRFAAPLERDEFVEIEAHNSLKPLLDDRLAGEIAVGKAQHLVFSSGFFHVRNFSVRAEPIGLLIHVPYWIGFFGAGQRAHLSVLDAC